MATGDIITADRYNNVQNRIAVIMGVGSGDSGYGQTLASAQKAIGSTVTIGDFLNLRTDLIKARQHQTGVDELANFPIRTTADQITEDDAANFETQIALIETNKFVLGAGESTPGSGITSQRTASWNGAINHTLQVDFGSANQARYFFNSGGVLTTRATLTGTSGAIGTNWQTLLTNMGTISLDHTATTASGTGTSYPIGFYDLTGSEQLVFQKSGAAEANYSSNTYSVYAYCDVTSNLTGGARYVYFRIEFNDAKGPNPNFDEDVTGTLTSIVEFIRATGTNVEVEEPVFTNVNEIT